MSNFAGETSLASGTRSATSSFIVCFHYTEIFLVYFPIDLFVN